MNLKKKKRALRILHDAEGFFIIHKNKKVRLTSASTLNKNKLQNQVIVNNYLHRKARVKKTAPSGATKPTGPTDKASRHPSDSDNFIRHSLVNQLEQLRHLQRNPPQHMPQSITVNPAINVHPANITINNRKEPHDPQLVQDTEGASTSTTKDALKSDEFTSLKGPVIPSGTRSVPPLRDGALQVPATPISLGTAALILTKIFNNSESLNTLLDYADIKHGGNTSIDRMEILKKYPGLIGILQNSPSRSAPEKRSLAYHVTEYIKNTKGSGGKRSSPEGGGRGIYNSEIDKIMEPYKPIYQGTFMRDELKNLKPASKMAFIMNTDPSSKEGKHWVACYLDADHDKSLEYYDSFGKDPPKGFDRDMKRVVDELHLPYMMKYKVNRIVEQKSSDNCGFHSMRFLINRMKGNKFTEATKYNVLSAEAKAKSMREKFGFI